MGVKRLQGYVNDVGRNTRCQKIGEARKLGKKERNSIHKTRHKEFGKCEEM